LPTSKLSSADTECDTEIPQLLSPSLGGSIGVEISSCAWGRADSSAESHIARFFLLTRTGLCG
jgi:hypothetical protein